MIAEPDIKQVMGGLLVQDRDIEFGDRTEMEVATERAPTDEEWRDLLFAWQICKHVRSNAIVLAKDQATAGIGAGQMSRVDSVRLAVDKSRLESLHGAVLASDAFFPFSDGPEIAIGAGVTAIIQPGGSRNDPRFARRPTPPAWRWSSRAGATSVTDARARPASVRRVPHTPPLVTASQTARRAPAGAGTLTLRAWQEAALERMSAWHEGPFLLSAAPGAGKTIPSLVYARGLLRAGIVDRVHVVCPTTPLTRQWAEAAGRLGVQLAPDSDELRRRATSTASPRRTPASRRRRSAGRRSAASARSSSPTSATTWATSSPGARASRGRSRRRRAGCCCPARRFAPTSARSPACATTTASRSPT